MTNSRTETANGTGTKAALLIVALLLAGVLLAGILGTVRLSERVAVSETKIAAIERTLGELKDDTKAIRTLLETRP